MGKLKTKHKRNKTRPKVNSIGSMTYTEAFDEMFNGHTIIGGGYVSSDGTHEEFCINLEDDSQDNTTDE